jgi:hypothetical protein
MDRTVQPVPDRTVTVDRTGPDREPSRALPRSGPTVGWSSLHPKMNRTDPSRADPWTGPWTIRDRGPDPRTVPENYYLKIDKFIFELLLFFTIF